eukprot:145328-Pyramimonas_sp.AAC.1
MATPKMLSFDCPGDDRAFLITDDEKLDMVIHRLNCPMEGSLAIKPKPKAKPKAKAEPKDRRARTIRQHRSWPRITLGP